MNELDEQILGNRIDLLEERIKYLELHCLPGLAPKLEAFRQRCTCNDGLTNAACPVHAGPSGPTTRQ